MTALTTIAHRIAFLGPAVAFAITLGTYVADKGFGLPGPDPAERLLERASEHVHSGIVLSGGHVLYLRCRGPAWPSFIGGFSTRPSRGASYYWPYGFPASFTSPGVRSGSGPWMQNGTAITVVDVSLWPICLLAALPAFALGFRTARRHYSIRRQRQWSSRGRCAGCGYDLSQNLSGTCPECGLKFGR